MSEIIEVELIAHDGVLWSWHAGHGLPHHGRSNIVGDELCAGTRLAAEVVTTGATYRLVRVVRGTAKVTARAAISPNHCKTSKTGTSADATQPGDVVLRRLRFSSPGRCADRTSKLRPCVVLEVSGDDLRVLPVFGSNSAVRREGMGRRLVNWRAAGLNKPSVIAATQAWVSRAGSGPIGRLSDVDHRRVFG